MSNDLKCLPINFYLLTMFDACLNGILRVALKAISWASGVELNYTIRTGNVFYYVYKLFLFLSRFTFSNVFLNFICTFFYIYDGGRASPAWSTRSLDSLQWKIGSNGSSAVLLCERN